MTEATLKTVTTDSGEVVLATTDIGGGEVAHTTEVSAEQVDGFDVEIVDAASPLARGSMAIIIDVTNTTNSSDTQDIALTIDGTVVDTQTLSLAGGESREIGLQWQGADNAAPGLYTAEVASEDDTDSRTVEIVDEYFEIREDPQLGTVAVLTAAVSVYDDVSGSDSAVSLFSLSGIDAMVFTPTFTSQGVPAFAGLREIAIELADGTDIIDAVLDEDLNKQSGDLVLDEENTVNVTPYSDTVALYVDDGLATIQ